MNRKKSVRELNGYRVIYKPNYPRAMKKGNWKGYVYEHIVVAERQLGRSLNKNEIIHHLDQNRSNNRRDNLLIVLRSQHAKLHSWIKAGAPGLKGSRKNAVNSKKANSICNSCKQQLQDKQRFYCSEECTRKARYGNKCPNRSVLKKELDTMSREALGRKYGVSGNAVKKWAIKYKLLS